MLILCEKPSVARQVAQALGRYTQKDGYIEAGGYLITWAFGHLLEIDDRIAPEKWSLDTLPVLPERFLYRPKDSSSGKQLKVIKELLKRVDVVANFGDAGREGELLIRLILQFYGWKGKTLRLWTSLALTPEVIKKELKNLKPAEEFDSLYWSALARQHADWIVGINLTRAVSLKATEGLWSVGRVQTPTLALIVQRDLQIENFRPEPYVVIKALFEKEGRSYEGVLLAKENAGDRPAEGDDNEEEREDYGRYAFKPEKAKKILEELQRLDKAHVEKVIKKVQKEYPPNLFSLTSLQRHMNRAFGWKAQKTLDLLQKLYEAGYVSYPRTDAEYMGEENKDLVKEVLKKLNREDLLPAVDRVGKRVFDNSKLTDHHAIIPLKNGEVEGEGGLLFKEVVKRFLAVFYPPHEYESLIVLTKAGQYLFESRGKRVIAQGWKELYGEAKDKLLPELKEKDPVKVKEIKPERRFTQPPQHYTEAELLKVMEKLSLGTPATRAGIIENLKDREYVRVQGKSLISTSKGRELIKKLEDSRVASPEMTGEWEQRLDRIYKNRLGFRGYKEFLESIKNFTSEEVCKVKEKDFSYQKEPVGKCPKCRADVVERAKSYSCTGCDFVLWKEFLGRQINFKQAQMLLEGNTVQMKGLKSKAGKVFDAGLKLKEDGKIELVFGGKGHETVKAEGQKGGRQASGKAFEKRKSGGYSGKRRGFKKGQKG